MELGSFNSGKFRELTEEVAALRRDAGLDPSTPGA
jgi:hypothetical protein